MLQLPRRWYTVITLVVGLLICGLLLRRFQRTDNRPYGYTGSHYPPLHFNKIPTDHAQGLPKVQYTFPAETPKEQEDRVRKQDEVREVFIRCWDSYKKLAWGHDELKPISGRPDTTFGGWGATLVDTLDTLWIMGMKKEFEEAVKVVTKIDFTRSEQKIVNVFETTIRYLGGLLGAYDVSSGSYPELLSKAVELGDLLYESFDTPQRIPVSRWEWLRKGQYPSEQVIVAELGSLTLEFTRLSQLTGDSKYYDAVYRIMLAFEINQEETRVPGLWPTVVDARKLTFSGTHFTIGGMSDSLYEYLPKEFMLLGGTVPAYGSMYKSALTAMKKHLFFRPVAPDPANDLKDNVPEPAQGVDVLFAGNAYLGSENRMVREPQGQHLGCFAGGMVALAAKTFKSETEDMPTAKKLVDGCIWAYDASPLGIMPEVFHLVPCDDTKSCIWEESRWLAAVLAFNPDDKDGDKKGASDKKATSDKPIDRARKQAKDKRLRPGFASIRDRRYILRPEAIESVFVLYRITGEKYLRDAAWRMFNSIKAATWVEFGYAAVKDVTVEPAEVKQADLMESFWLAETLKYFFLMFSEDSLVSLDEYVLNTEAHPFKRPAAGSPVRGTINPQDIISGQSGHTSGVKEGKPKGTK